MAVEAGDSFQHEALLYEGDEGFLEGTVPFLEDGVSAGEDVLVVVDARKIALLHRALGPIADGIEFADMAGVGANPARIIPAWRNFADRATDSGRGFRGIGEPVWPGRTAAQLAECHRHEALLNLAFTGTGPWTLLCPYDAAALDPTVVEEAHRTHPTMTRAGSHYGSERYGGLSSFEVPFDDPLPEPGGPVAGLAFDGETLAPVRAFVRLSADGLGFDEERTSALVLAVNEIATNSVLYGGGRGALRLWQEPGALVCEVRDDGHIAEPLVGRALPPEDAPGGRGLWLANQLCDLVQIRSSPAGTVVRLHVLD